MVETARAPRLGESANAGGGYRALLISTGLLRLAVLAPDIVEAILGGWADQRVMLERLERPVPMAWEEQRGVFHSRQ